jgi:alkylation response protein AidB-like acyl-CoA dehydrogenase
MDLRFDEQDEAFRDEARTWLTEQLTGDFAGVRGRGGPGDEHALFEERFAWERRLGEAGWIGVGWPTEHGGRGLSLPQQVIWFEEYARAEGPGRVGIVGEGLAGPTIGAFGDDDQRARFLPRILDGTELWCQGYSEPNAGSDLANVSTRAERDGDEWVISGQKVWTSLAHWADWCFVLARTSPPTDPAKKPPRKHDGLSYLLVPMRQDGIEIRPIRQVTGTSEFNEVFFDGARTPAANVVGGEGNGWTVAMGTLAFERGASTLGQQLQFENELRRLVELARKTGRLDEPVLRQRITDAWIGLRIMRWNSLRVLSGMTGAELPREAMIAKLYWATWHRELGNLAMDVLGAYADLAEAEPGYELTALQRLFLFTRADTIYAGSNEIQRNLIGERALGLPREPKATP